MLVVFEYFFGILNVHETCMGAHTTFTHVVCVVFFFFHFNVRGGYS